MINFIQKLTINNGIKHINSNHYITKYYHFLTSIFINVVMRLTITFYSIIVKLFKGFSKWHSD